MLRGLSCSFARGTLTSIKGFEGVNKLKSSTGVSGSFDACSFLSFGISMPSCNFGKVDPLLLCLSGVIASFYSSASFTVASLLTSFAALSKDYSSRFGMLILGSGVSDSYRVVSLISSGLECFLIGLTLIFDGICSEVIFWMIICGCYGVLGAST